MERNLLKEMRSFSMLKRHKKHQQLQQQKSTKYNQTMRNLNTILSQHQEQYQACKEYSKMFVECMYIHMNEWCEGVCPPENHRDGEEIRWYLPWSYSPFHSKTAAKHIPRASGSRKVKLGSKNSHGVIMMLEVSLGIIAIWHENTKGKVLRIGHAWK